MHRRQSELGERASEGQERGLLKRIEARDREAMRELHVLYYNRLARFLRRLTRNREIVDEAINDTLAIVWQKAAGFRGDSRVSTWIMGIAYRRGLSLLQAERRAVSRRGLSTNAEQVPFPAAEQADVTNLLEQALAYLSSDHRAVLQLSYFLGHSCLEIAAIMRCPANTVKTRLFHARNKLRALVLTLSAPRRDLNHCGGVHHQVRPDSSSLR